MSVQQINLVDYGLTNALQNVFPAPIVSLRAPTTADKAQIGTVWVYKTTNTAYILTSIVNNSATWSSVSGGAGDFASLTVTPGPINLTGTTVINIAGGASTTIGTGGTGAVLIGNATGNTGITGSLLTSAGITATTGNITATAGALVAGTTVTAGTGLTVTAGNATITNGNIVLSTAATYITLPGPVKIMSGGGAPAGGLASEVGDFYINTNAASATTRLYVATAPGIWTNLTCAA